MFGLSGREAARDGAIDIIVGERNRPRGRLQNGSQVYPLDGHAPFVRHVERYNRPLQPAIFLQGEFAKRELLIRDLDCVDRRGLMGFDGVEFCYVLR